MLDIWKTIPTTWWPPRFFKLLFLAHLPLYRIERIYSEYWQVCDDCTCPKSISQCQTSLSWHEAANYRWTKRKRFYFHPIWPLTSQMCAKLLLCINTLKWRTRRHHVCRHAAEKELHYANWAQSKMASDHKNVKDDKLDGIFQRSWWLSTDFSHSHQLPMEFWLNRLEPFWYV